MLASEPTGNKPPLVSKTIYLLTYVIAYIQINPFISGGFQDRCTMTYTSVKPELFSIPYGIAYLVPAYPLYC